MSGWAAVPHDLRYAIRRLRNSPGFSTVAIATIALAIGANTAMFSFVNGILIRALPYPDPDRIVRLLERTPSGGLNGISTLNYLDWVRQNTVFQYVAAEAGWRPTLTGADEPIALRGARVSVHYFDLYGVTPALGRTFVDGEGQSGHDRVVLLSHRLWQSRFGSDPAIVGRQILLDGEAHTVIGILPRGGPFDRTAAGIWKPLAFEPASMTRDFRWLAATARLAPGVTLEQARAAMGVVGQRLASAYPESNKGWGIAVDRLADVLIAPGLQTAITVLFAATVFVLLIGCANLANLALARTASRDGEMAVRAALGASRWRLIQELLTEHVVIALCGGVAGVAVGYVMIEWIQSLIPPETLPPAVDIRLDLSALLFALIAAIVTGVLFGLAPATEITRPRQTSGLKGSGRHATTARPRGMRGGLVVAEVALAFILLVASGLLMRSLFKLLDVDPGFDARNVLTAALPIPQDQHPDPVELNAYLGSVRAAVEGLPGVRATAITSALPLQGWGFGVPYSIAGREGADPADRRPAFFKIVSPSYFAALGLTLRAGRVLRDSDEAGAPRVTVINETLARREFPSESPIGQHILVPDIVAGRTRFGAPTAWEVVGVTAGEKINGLGDAISAGMYVSNLQSPTYAVNLVVRAGERPESLERSVRSAVHDVDRDQALSDVRSLEQIVNESMLGNRVVSMILAIFSAMALSLAVAGIYGVISYTGLQRTHEMGLRAALGATAGDLCRLIMRRGMLLTVGGLAIGLAGMIPSTDVLSSMLYGVGTYDPLTIAIVSVVLSAVAGLACFLPAWRVAHADPMEALRYP